MLFSSMTEMQLVFKGIFSEEIFNKVERVPSFLPNKKISRRTFFCFLRLLVMLNYPFM